ncbi:MAG: RNA polymerase sigma-70 factor [Williamsia sp.]|nr:RNA polymerase sigma-70 factor [Williamsia sp.]
MQKDSSLYILYKQAFHAYYQPLCQYALTLVASAADCEDMVQEIFLHVWEKKKELIGKEELRYYLFTAIRNRCLNYLQKNKKDRFTQLTEWEEPVETIIERDWEEPVDLAGAVAEALDRLPLRCREVFVLSRMGKLTYQQIAETTGISVKTVENQIGKALKIMRLFVREKRLFSLSPVGAIIWLAHCVGVPALSWFFL